MTGASLTKTSELFGVARSTVSKVMTTFEKRRTSSLKILEENDESCLIETIKLLHRLLKRITRIQLQKLHPGNPVSSKTVRELHKFGFMGGLQSENHSFHKAFRVE